MSLEKRKQKALKIVAKLKELYPQAKIELNFSNPVELLIAVILSAQCTDKMVNRVTEKLFKKYKSLDDYVNADQTVFEQDIKSTGFYKNKAKNILATTKLIKEQYNSKVPDTMEEILKLPGVARKTANVVLGNAYGIVDGIAVDTHVRRLTNLLGLTESDDPIKIERDLMGVIPREEWLPFSHRLILYGRYYCPAKAHDHSKCPLSNIS